MPNAMFHVARPRCFLVYALAPQGMPAADANRIFNACIGNRRLPLPVFHDHFIHPPIFSRSPAGFDDQIAFTLRAYRGQDWEQLQRQHHPQSGDPVREAETAAEDDTQAEA